MVWCPKMTALLNLRCTYLSELARGQGLGTEPHPNQPAGVTRVVDLCAAPGSWSQVLSRRLKYADNSPKGTAGNES
jgi:hypothetical protein